jgi:hypothetical protein
VTNNAKPPADSILTPRPAIDRQWTQWTGQLQGQPSSELVVLSRDWPIITFYLMTYSWISWWCVCVPNGESTTWGSIGTIRTIVFFGGLGVLKQFPSICHSASICAGKKLGCSHWGMVINPSIGICIPVTDDIKCLFVFNKKVLSSQHVESSIQDELIGLPDNGSAREKFLEFSMLSKPKSGFPTRVFFNIHHSHSGHVKRRHECLVDDRADDIPND